MFIIQPNSQEQLNQSAILAFSALVLCLSIASCRPSISPPPEPTPSPHSPVVDRLTPPPSAPSTPGLDHLLTLVTQDLSTRLALPLEDIEVVSALPVDWENAGLGCPFLGADYAQVITPGYQISLVALGITYTYHTDLTGLFVLCGPGDVPLLPVIPVTPGEIQDGIPWMPVDPPD